VDGRHEEAVVRGVPPEKRIEHDSLGRKAAWFHGLQCARGRRGIPPEFRRRIPQVPVPRLGHRDAPDTYDDVDQPRGPPGNFPSSTSAERKPCQSIQRCIPCRRPPPPCIPSGSGDPAPACTLLTDCPPSYLGASMRGPREPPPR
jgi:hypothetical protein